MPLVKDQILIALKAIARGSKSKGRALAGEEARQLARKVLTEAGLDW